MPNTSITQFETMTIDRPPAAVWRGLGCTPAMLVLLAVAGGLTALLVRPWPSVPAARALAFEERWEPVRELLLAQTPIAVKTSRYVQTEVEPVVEPVVAIEPEPDPEPAVAITASRRARSQPIERDVCARHNLRKVYVSRWSWRCRRK